MLRIEICIRQVTRAEPKSGAVVKHQRVFVVLKTTSIAKRLFKSGAAPLHHSLVTSLYMLLLLWEGGFHSATATSILLVKTYPSLSCSIILHTACLMSCIVYTTFKNVGQSYHGHKTLQFSTIYTYLPHFLYIISSTLQFCNILWIHGRITKLHHYITKSSLCIDK